MSLPRTLARRVLLTRNIIQPRRYALVPLTHQLSRSLPLLLSPAATRSFVSESRSSNYSYQPVIQRPMNYGIAIVPEQSAWVIERFGRFSRILSPGLHLLIPFVDSIAYIHTLKEQAIPISNQQAITMDNVTINIDGVLYLRVLNPRDASYGVNDIYYAMTQLAQTTMRSELGKITLDQTFANRESLNFNIVKSINAAAQPWGVQCLRYEIKDITPPSSVKYAMDMQAEAERKKRATILDSEGSQQAEINVADGQRQATILAAQGEAAAILAKAEATARGIDLLAESIARRGGKDAVGLRIAEQYVEAFGQIAQKGNTMLLPSGMSDPSSMIAQAMAIYSQVSSKAGGGKGGQQEDGQQGEGEQRALTASGMPTAGAPHGQPTAPMYFSAASPPLSSSYLQQPPSPHFPQQAAGDSRRSQ